MKDAFWLEEEGSEDVEDKAPSAVVDAWRWS